MEHIKKQIRTIPNWPKQGIQFRDITTLLKAPKEFKDTINILTERYKQQKIDAVVGIDSRGFLFGAPVALELNASFVPVRKKGKLPGATVSVSYELEYGEDTLEIHIDALEAGSNVLVVDDLLATGGTAQGAIELVRKAKGNVVGCAFVVELPALGGRQKLKDVDVYSIVTFEGE